MKKYLLFLPLLLALVMITAGCNQNSNEDEIEDAQDYFMYVGGEKRYFEISSNEILVLFAENTEISTVKSFIEEETSFHVSDISTTDYEQWHLISFLDTDKTTIRELIHLIQHRDRNKILYSGVVFIDKHKRKIAALTNQIIVRLKQESDYYILQKSIEAYKIDNVRQNEFEKKTYLLSVNYLSEKDAMQIANELYETGLFEYAEPDLMLFIRYATNDTYFSDQWGLNNTGQYGGVAGVDIKAPQAWTVTTGSPNIKIAILDTGIDLTHPDLIDNLEQGYDVYMGYVYEDLILTKLKKR